MNHVAKIAFRIFRVAVVSLIGVAVLIYVYDVWWERKKDARTRELIRTITAAYYKAAVEGVVPKPAVGANSVRIPVKCSFSGPIILRVKTDVGDEYGMRILYPRRNGNATNWEFEPIYVIDPKGAFKSLR